MKNVVGNENYRVQNDKFEEIEVVNVKGAFKDKENYNLAKNQKLHTNL